jgi:hypothetical protein
MDHMDPSPVNRKIPALDSDRGPLKDRTRYDFSDYGFVVDATMSSDFEIVPVQANDEEAFLFCYPRRDLDSPRFSLYNLHAFLKRTGTLDDFAHSLGPSVRTIELSDTTVLGVPARIYHRSITMKDLFEGAPQVIDFIGGSPDLLVVDSHCYFRHRHNHYYTGMIHSPGADDSYEALRQQLFAGIRLV